jgi:Protein of unknown function (DUF2997)
MISSSVVFFASLLPLYFSAPCDAFLILAPPSDRRGAFVPFPKTRLAREDNSSEGRLERIEAKIFPGGRIEYSIHGIKGPDCLKLTESLNEALGGRVIRSEPTEEFFEQDVKIDQTVTNSNLDGFSGDSWEGASSW